MYKITIIVLCVYDDLYSVPCDVQIHPEGQSIGI